MACVKDSKQGNYCLFCLGFVWRFFKDVLLWTPDKKVVRLLTDGSKRVYFIFQSSLIQSQVGIINGVSVANIIFMAVFTQFLGAPDSLNLYVGVLSALMNVALIIASIVIRKKYLSVAVKAQYVISFLSFLTSFVLPYKVIHSTALLRTQHVLLASTLFIFFTVYFQWSTVLTILVLVFFDTSNSVNAVRGRHFSASEVCLYILLFSLCVQTSYLVK